MSKGIAHVLFAAIGMAFQMAGNVQDLEDCAKDNKRVTDLLPDEHKAALRNLYVERRDYLRETRPS
jgi:hypothetical protein